jgi:hypothetical protein
LEAEVGQILAEVESRGAKATFGYGSTLAMLEDVAHVSPSAIREPQPSHHPHPRPSLKVDLARQNGSTPICKRDAKNLVDVPTRSVHTMVTRS